MGQVLPIFYLVNTIIMAEEAIPPPDLYWSFDNQCSDSCSTCFDSNIPTGIPEYRLKGGCNSTITTDPLIEGVVGDAMSLKGQEVKIFNASETCITVLDKRMPTAGGRLEDKCTSFTLTFWTRIDSIEAGFKQVFLFTSGIYDPLAATYPSSTGISVSIVSTRNIVARVQTPGVFHERVIHESFKEGVWTHLTLVWIKNQHLKLYINGTLKESSDTPTLIDYPNINRPYEIIFGTEDLFNFTIDEVKIWFKSYAGNISEIFRQASIDPSDFTTTPQTTTPEETTTTTTTTTAAATTTTAATTTSTTKTTTTRPTTTSISTASTTTRPLYLDAEIPPLVVVSNDLRNNHEETQEQNFTNKKTLEDSSEKTMEITKELVKIITEESINLEQDVAISYITVVSETTNNIVAEENAETWQKVETKTESLNQIIENADNTTKVIVESMTVDDIDEIEVVKHESVSIVLVPTHTGESVTISSSSNVEVGLPRPTVVSLSRNTTIIFATSIHSGAETCYDDIPPAEVDIVEREDKMAFEESKPALHINMPFQIISEIVSVNIKPRPANNEKITFVFRHIRNISDKTNYTLYCAYINKTSARWTNLNCNITETNRTHTSFVMKHLTNFAILMQIVDFEIPEQHLSNLSLITYVGCSISVFCLVLSLCIFAMVNTIRGHKTERYHLHANLAFAMLLGQVTFLAGAAYPPGTDSCKATAILLHFFYLSAFSWMFIEGLHLYNLVVKVFRSAQSKLGYYYMVGWGIPLLICVISVAAAFGGYGEVANCWLDMQNTRVIWAFVGPALFVVLVNIIILIKVTWVITTLAKSQDNCVKCMTDKATIVICAKAIAVLMPILGVTWMFGVLAVNQDTIVFQYIFAIFNSLQGFFLFMFHCVFNSETRASLIYRTKSMRTDLHSRSATHSRSRRQTKVEIMKNPDQVPPRETDRILIPGSEANARSAVIQQRYSHNPTRSYSVEPMSSRKASSASRGNKQEFSRTNSANSGKIKTRRINPNVCLSTAW